MNVLKDNMIGFVVYILRTSKNTLYTGQTNNLTRRLSEHKKSKRGAKYTRGFDGLSLVYTEFFKTRKEAFGREAAIKRMNKKEKEKLVANFL